MYFGKKFACLLSTSCYAVIVANVWTSASFLYIWNDYLCYFQTFQSLLYTFLGLYCHDSHSWRQISLMYLGIFWWYRNFGSLLLCHIGHSGCCFLPPDVQKICYSWIGLDKQIKAGGLWEPNWLKRERHQSKWKRGVPQGPTKSSRLLFYRTTTFALSVLIKKEELY